MSFSAVEISNYAGRPALLFEFVRGPVSYRYTAADRDITVGDDTYTAKPLSCGEMRFTGEAQTDELTISAPASLQFFEDFTAAPPSNRVQAIVRRYHVGYDPVVRWSGVVNRVIRSGRKVNIVCDSLLAGMRQNGIRVPWQRGCPHALYGPDCRASKAGNAYTGDVTALDGVTIVVDAFGGAADGSLRGGWVEWTTDEGFPAWRAINEHSGTAVALLGGSRGIETGTTVTAYRGCPHTPEGCQSFGNDANYGGFRHLPSKSPFDGNPVF
jgi:uncharacterized phage protein (TIGR02218 family)